jgi:hypothetical protein
MPSNRYLGMHFFTNDAGGNQMMYVNLFWAWGAPANPSAHGSIEIGTKRTL